MSRDNGFSFYYKITYDVYMQILCFCVNYLTIKFPQFCLYNIVSNCVNDSCGTGVQISMLNILVLNTTLHWQQYTK